MSLLSKLFHTESHCTFHALPWDRHGDNEAALEIPGSSVCGSRTISDRQTLIMHNGCRLCMAHPMDSAASIACQRAKDCEKKQPCHSRSPCAKSIEPLRHKTPLKTGIHKYAWCKSPMERGLALAITESCALRVASAFLSCSLSV